MRLFLNIKPEFAFNSISLVFSEITEIINFSFIFWEFEGKEYSTTRVSEDTVPVVQVAVYISLDSLHKR